MKFVVDVIVVVTFILYNEWNTFHLYYIISIYYIMSEINGKKYN